MSSESKRACGAALARRSLLPLALTFLLVEFLDEVVDGVRGAAWPLVREDLRLSYTEVGAVLTVPALFGNLVEPWLFILADVWRRRALALAGGFAFALAALLVGLSQSFVALLAAYCLFSPASGAFVNLSQASLMDAEPARREQNMARWTLAGSLGNVVGPLVVAAVAGWRGPFVGLAVFSLVVLGLAWRAPFPTPAAHEGGARAGLAEGLREAGRALRRREVWRWLVLLEVGDLTADVFRGFLALYFADVVGAGEAGAALAVIVWTLVGLPGDFLLLPLLERVRGVKYLRVSMAVQAALFPVFLLAPGAAAKLALLGLLGLSNAGWYAILKARLYAVMPGRSGTALTLHNLSAFAGSLAPLALGAFAERYGLGSMMWLLAAGPPLLLVGLLTAPTDEGGEEEGGVR
ncbi:MAG TPA: MFS transporter [Pyrinomonadaceae bacterium]|nr:MFS transporter [Pyrinomonadaceae bacterium]